MVPIPLLALCFLIGISFARGTCSISLPSSDERSCDYDASQPDNYRTSRSDKVTESDDVYLRISESDSPLGDNDFISQSEYQRARQDAIDSKYESSIHIIRKAAKSWNNEPTYIDLCAFLLDYGHTRAVPDAELLYKEAEGNCKKAIALNPYSSEAKYNLDAISKSREIRGIVVELTKIKKISAGRFVGKRKKNPELKSKTEKKKKSGYGESGIDMYSEHAALAKALRIYPGPTDDGNLEFKLYNGSSVDPHMVMLHLGEVYVEDDFISEDERRALIAIIDRGLHYKDRSGEKGPIGTVLAGTMSMIGSELSKKERIVVATLRERIVNRANELTGLDTSMYSSANGVRVHATALLRYIQSGKHNVHHDNDFVNRCLSSSIVLNDDFEGGDFNLHTTKNPDERNLEGFPIIGTVKPKPGRLSLFLSESMHSVSEIVSGTRYVLFLWFTCDADAEYQLDDPLEPVDDKKAWVASA